jgi:parvulin-like peptidyl-prolyl isomerase
MKHFSVAYALLLLTFLIVLQSCSGVIENDNFDTDGYVLVEGKEVRPEYVLKIFDNPVSLAEYRYYYLNQKFELDGGDDSVWTDYPEYVEDLSDYVDNTLIEVYSIRKLAEENGVTPNFEAVKTQLDEYRGSMSSSDFKKGLREYYLTEELYEYILQGYDLYTTLFDTLFSSDGKYAMTDDELLDYLEDNYVRVKHVLVYPNTTMSDADYEEYLQNILERAKTEEDFDALVSEFSNDTVMPDYGYYFAEGEMPEEFERAGRALEIGEVSDIVKTSHGYHVIKRLPIDSANLTELADVVYNKIFADLINAEISSAEVEYAPEYENITPSTLK